MNDRDCESCVHHTGGSCSVWECSFERKKDDLISRRAAIDAANDWLLDCFKVHKQDRSCGLIRRLEDLPSVQPTQTDTSNTLKALDCVERRAAIDAADSIINRDTSGNNDVVKAMTAWKEYIKALPSAQPKIVRCIECKHCEHWYADKGRCFLWHEDGISVFKDGFCNYAERREE